MLQKYKILSNIKIIKKYIKVTFPWSSNEFIEELLAALHVSSDSLMSNLSDCEYSILLNQIIFINKYFNKLNKIFNYKI